MITLKPPCIITPRLLPGVKIGDSFLSIEYAGSSSDHRTKFQIHIDTSEFEHSDDNLRSGCQGGDLQSGLCSALSFLAACGESYAYRMRTGRKGENEELFPPKVAEWCYKHSDELSSLSFEIEEGVEKVLVEA